MSIRVGALALSLCLVFILASHSEPFAQPSSFEDEDCLACHEAYDSGLTPTVHRLASTIDKPVTTVTCVSCHPGADSHFDDPAPGTIGNPLVMEPADVADLCTACHESHPEAQTAGFDPHINLELSCTSCHTVHGTNETLLIDRSGGFCGTCHVAAVNDFRKRSSHPLVEGSVGCLDCHGFTLDSEPDYGHGTNAPCFGCHPQQGGPFLFEHEATASFTPEGDGCVACHAPHGSPNDRLLTQPDDRLCLQCHAAPPGHLTAHGGALTSYACMDCHSETHGSYDNLFLLDPQLGDKLASGPDGCFCHYYR
ncbi:MAG: hypothetical protein JSW34_05125 [Candidatus Zixiibacteriota bacterium]|nr:MAG: hypothetical protein JSW34_05125 [candidate division Zixibacteria bacterium]